MTVVALTNFIEATNSRGRAQFRFQNSKPGEVIRHRGLSFPYLSFGYQGAAKNRSGDNLEAALVMSNNEISMGYAVEATRNRWNVRVDSCSMNPSTFEVARMLTTETWIAASMSYDADWALESKMIEVLLSSSIDAVGAVAPSRVLTKQLVGALPVSGSVQNR